tara:strand:- start:543 stop:1043 length:501 start_codon:yes stop_codon:yes gene_type:complete
MRNSIEVHKERDLIEQIILECKFSGYGSVEIRKRILSKLGAKFSRPTIDKYYKISMQGDKLSSLIKQSKEEAILTLSTENMESSSKPSFDIGKARDLSIFFKDLKSWDFTQGESQAKDTMQELYIDTLTLMLGNMQAHKEGRERLKPEYLKYFKELREMFKHSSNY